jgi:hypothetical protein
MFFNEKVFRVGKPAPYRTYEIRRAPFIPLAARPLAEEQRLPRGIALIIMTLMALGLWGLIIFVFRAVILG